MPRREWLLIFLTAGMAMAVAAIVPVSHRNMQESLSLTGALNAISRKQRSLDTSPQNYDFNYHGAHSDRDRKINKERQAEREIEEENEQLEFLPNVVGQLETADNSFQDLNDKMRERALIDYLESVLQQEEPIISQFRERERGIGHKRTGGSDRINIGNKQLAKLFLEQQNESPYSIGDENENGDGNGEETGNENGNGDGNGEGYTNDREMLYDRYMINRGSNKDFESVDQLLPSRNAGPMSWGELLNKESLVRDQHAEVDDTDITERDLDPNLLYLSLAERKTMNGGYPVGRDYRNYRNVAKRFPVAKRSPQSLSPKKQLTDPKVAQDLGSLFGTQSCHDHDHDHDPDHDHNHNHDHDHDHDHDHVHDHDHEHNRKQQKQEGSTEAPKANLSMKSQKDSVAKDDKLKPIDVRKKSIDWSQYFGIDRRRKKASQLPIEETGNDDYYNKLLREFIHGVKGDLRDYGTENKLVNKYSQERILSMLKEIRSMVVQNVLRHMHWGSSACIEEAGEILERRLKALDGLKDSYEIYTPANQTSECWGSDNRIPRDKRNDDQMAESQGVDGDGDGDADAAVCPVGRELKEIEEWCRFVVSMLDGDNSRKLYTPCVMLELCHTCFQTQDGSKKMCLMYHLLKSKEICGTHPRKSQKMSCFKAVAFFAGKKYSFAR